MVEKRLNKAFCDLCKDEVRLPLATECKGIKCSSCSMKVQLKEAGFRKVNEDGTATY